MTKITGILTKAVGGFYYVDCGDKIFECKARGVFRKNGITPCVGDNVEITLQDNGYASLSGILPRKNNMVRPQMSNLDNLIIVASICEPYLNTLIIDKMIAAAVNKNIKPILVITKTDLQNPDEIYNVYKKSNIDVICTSIDDENSIEHIKSLFPDKITALIGNSGVGKSTLLNRLFPELNLKTGDISKKLGRGKHTTRQVELFKLGGGYILDTPGFSTVDIEHYEMIEKDKIQYCFSEFSDYLGKCKFTSCSHTCEKGCAVLQAVKENKIQKSRHESYVAMYNEIKDIKEWQINKQY